MATIFVVWHCKSNCHHSVQWITQTIAAVNCLLLALLSLMIKDNPGAAEDLLLIQAIRNGDQPALGTLYDKYAPALMGIICRIVHKDAIADEILQSVFQVVWQKAGSFDASKQSVFFWLISMARHTAIDKMRIEQLANPGARNTIYLATSPNSNNATAEQQLFELVYFNGLSCAEAATALQVPVEYMQKYLRLAIKNLAGVAEK